MAGKKSTKKSIKDSGPTPIGRILENPDLCYLVAKQLYRRGGLRNLALVSRTCYHSAIPVLYRNLRLLYDDHDSQMIQNFCSDGDNPGLIYVKSVVLRHGLRFRTPKNQYASDDAHMTELETEIIGTILEARGIEDADLPQDIDVRRNHKYHGWRRNHPGSDADTSDSEPEPEASRRRARRARRALRCRR